MQIRDSRNINDERGRILVVDSGTAICEALRMHFGAEEFAVDHCTCYDDWNSVGTYILVIISFDIDGQDYAVEVVKRFREMTESADAGIIVCSENLTVEGVINVLNAGADDYLHVPFSHRELLARTHAVLRRYV